MVRSAPDLRRYLAEAELEPQGFLRGASNHTLLVSVGGVSTDRPIEEIVDDPAAHGVVLAVYKPRDGERPLLDFPPGTLCQREVAAFEVSEFLGWGLVPPTLMREGPLGPGSVQLFVPHDPRRHYFVLADEPPYSPALVQLAVFDLVGNNADRKASHVLDRGDGAVYAIDHGLMFHADPKLRTVIWDHPDPTIPTRLRNDLRRLADELAGQGALASALSGLLNDDEIEALAARAAAVATRATLPVLPEGRRPYPWPPL